MGARLYVLEDFDSGQTQDATTQKARRLRNSESRQDGEDDCCDS